ncbi:hypothetical protein PTW37_03650 [Arthrobacter agilis]|uniref:hypothetical protein n=1 Tax=Arthrobacter agilis TaxID=37921 RepID=UPI002366EFCA|nr:hypothetical protein [Arthrobacter agilis]WDF34033.1 hypothetical protein PTW37_03650 [Arthrobacter agilis]
MSNAAGARRAAVFMVGVAALALLGVALVLLGPGLLSGLRSEGTTLLGGPECVVQTADGEVGLDRDQAQRATTAVALRARGAAAPDTTGLDAAVLQALTDGPADDAGPVLSCKGSVDETLQVEELTPSGLTPRAQQVRSSMGEVFGEQSLGGFAPGGVGSGHGGESTHYDGRAIDVFFRPVTEENRRQGWILAHWLVAHAEDLDIQYVIFDDQFWSARIARGGWHDYDAPEPANEILRHLDHVHVDVLGGGEG